MMESAIKPQYLNYKFSFNTQNKEQQSKKVLM